MSSLISSSIQSPFIANTGRTMAFGLCVAAVIATGFGCDGPAIEVDSGPLDAVDAGTNEPDDALSDVYMAEDVLLTVEVTMDPNDFETLRKQSRDYFNTFEPGCLERPFESPFSYFPASVVIDGVPGEDSVSFEEVGIRKKGFFGSVVEDKPSLKIKFDEYVDGERFFGEKRLTLNNQNQDPSLIRTCLAYTVFRRAGVAAPRCNFAEVFVNGQRMGIYANVDAIKKPFLRRHFDADEGDLFEGTFSDFREGWTGTFEKKSNEEDLSRDEIEALTRALEDAGDDVVAALGDVIDLDAFYTYWAAETLTSHWDGYSGNTNNFYLYVDPNSGLLRFIPWGTDGTFQGPFLLIEDELAPDSVMATGFLTRKLYADPEGRRAYLARLDELMADAWNEDVLEAEIDRLHALFADRLALAEQAPVQRAVDDVREFVQMRRGLIDAERADGPIEWDVPLREDICLVDYGTINFTFETTWGSHPSPTFQYEALGTATFSGELFGEPLAPQSTGSGAGIEENGEQAGWTVVVATANDGENPTGYFYFQIEPGLAEAGAALDVDGGSVRGFLFTVVPTFQVIGGVYEGTLTLDAFEMEAGAPIRGTFEGALTGGPLQ